jgi:hypothetical protein
MKTFTLTAIVSSDNPEAIKKTLKKFIPDGSIKKAEKGFFIEATIRGESARDLNRALLSALRQADRKTRLRAEWTSGGIAEQFFDYVPKGSRKV